MRDVTLDEIAEEVREALRDMDIHINPLTTRALTKNIIKTIEGVLDEGKVQIKTTKSHIARFRPMLDVEKLCDEFATGEVGVSYITMLKRNTLNKPAKSFVNRRMGQTIDEHARRSFKKVGNKKEVEEICLPEKGENSLHSTVREGDSV